MLQFDAIFLHHRKNDMKEKITPGNISKERLEEEMSPLKRCQQVIRQLAILGSQAIIGEDNTEFKTTLTNMVDNLNKTGTVDGKPWDIKLDIPQLNSLGPEVINDWNNELVNRMKLMVFVMSRLTRSQSNVKYQEIISSLLSNTPRLGVRTSIDQLLDRDATFMQILHDAGAQRDSYEPFSMDLVMNWAFHEISQDRPVPDAIMVSAISVLDYLIYDTNEMATRGDNIQQEKLFLRDKITETLKKRDGDHLLKARSASRILHLASSNSVDEYLGQLNDTEKMDTLLRSRLVNNYLNPPKPLTILTMLPDELLPFESELPERKGESREFDQIEAGETLMAVINGIDLNNVEVTPELIILMNDNYNTIKKLIDRLPIKQGEALMDFLAEFKMTPEAIDLYKRQQKSDHFATYDWEAFIRLSTGNNHTFSGQS